MKTSELQLGGNATPLFHTVAVAAVGRGDSLDWSTMHVIVHLVLRVTERRRSWISASDTVGGWKFLFVTETSTLWVGRRRKRKNMQARDDSKFYYFVT